MSGGYHFTDMANGWNLWYSRPMVENVGYLGKVCTCALADRFGVEYRIFNSKFRHVASTEDISEIDGLIRKHLLGVGA